MSLTRRDTLLRFLFGAGGIGLRALATGLPASFLLNPRKANAQTCAQAAKAQYVIFATSGSGDPIGANVPGTYPDVADPTIVHAPGIPTTSLSLRGRTYQTGQPWATPAVGGFLPQSVLDRTQFWHIMTNTLVHALEGYALELMGASPANEMMPSLLAKTLAPCLGTLQTQPVTLGATRMSFNGQALPMIPPSTLKDILGSPTGPLSVAPLQALRDQTMTSIYGEFYKDGATPAQKTFIDQWSRSQSQLRGISESLLSNLSAITDNTAASQMTAAVALIQMNVAPVFTVNIPFGGDNHFDTGLVTEAAQNTSGVQTIASLMSQLQAANLEDKVTFMSLNVFGRSLEKTDGFVNSALNGRTHNANLQTSVVIGKPFPGGVIGGVGRVAQDFGCTAMESSTGLGTSSGDIAPVETLGAFARTMLAGVGGDPTIIATGKVVTAAIG